MKRHLTDDAENIFQFPVQFIIFSLFMHYMLRVYPRKYCVSDIYNKFCYMKTISVSRI